MKEIWKDVTGYEGYYQVSNIGNVRSLDRVVKRGKGHMRIKGKPIAMSELLDGSGRMIVRFQRNNKSTTHYIHSLVVREFIGPRPEGFEIHHKDGNVKNNIVGNLMFISPHSHRTIHNAGELAFKSKLTERKVRRMRTMYRTGNFTMPALAELFGISIASTQKAIRGRSWKHVPGAVTGPIHRDSQLKLFSD